MDEDLVPDTELRRRAEADCRAAVRTLHPAEAEVDVLETGTEWDEDELRHVYGFDARVWLGISEFEVVLDDAGRPVGYVDGGKWRQCEWRPLPPERIVALAVQTGIVTPAAVVKRQVRDERGAIDATLLADPADPEPRRYRVLVNPVLERVISILPEEPLP